MIIQGVKIPFERQCLPLQLEAKFTFFSSNNAQSAQESMPDEAVNANLYELLLAVTAGRQQLLG